MQKLSYVGMKEEEDPGRAPWGITWAFRVPALVNSYLSSQLSQQILCLLGVGPGIWWLMGLFREGKQWGIVEGGGRGAATDAEAFSADTGA